jgi:hypothetical protein
MVRMAKKTKPVEAPIKDAAASASPGTQPALQLPGTSKTKVEKVNSYLSTVSTTLAILGGVGTLGVWLAANFYTGLVEVRPQGPAEFVEVRVFDQKGESTTFHTRRFPLMPGEYHLEIKTSEKAPFHADTTVQFTKTSVVEVPAHPVLDNESKRRWWQIWKKKPEQS